MLLSPVRPGWMPNEASCASRMRLMPGSMRGLAADSSCSRAPTTATGSRMKVGIYKMWHTAHGLLCSSLLCSDPMIQGAAAWQLQGWAHQPVDCIPTAAAVPLSNTVEHLSTRQPVRVRKCYISTRQLSCDPAVSVTVCMFGS